MKYHCTGCDYIYDELKWEIDEEIAALTFFDDLPSDFFCPHCDTHKDDFVILSPEINIPLDVHHLTQLEAQHFPIYDIKDDILTLEIWQIEHPSEEDHFIYRIALFDESWDMIEEKTFTPWNEPKASFDIEYLDEFEVRVFCSKDGVFSTGLIVV